RPRPLDGAHPVLDPEQRSPFGETVLKRGLGAGDIVGVNGRYPPRPVARDRVLGVAEAFEPALAEAHGPARDIDLPARDARVDHRVLDRPALRQVLYDGDRSLEDAALVAHRDALQSDREDRAVLAAHVVLDVAPPGDEELGQHHLAGIARTVLGEERHRWPP